MDFNSLKAFVAVAETGGFVTASEQLHITQPAVSKRIASLETLLDTRLFDRIGRRVQLTEAGKALLPRARSLLVEIADTQRAVSKVSAARAADISGKLCIATSHHIGLHRLPPVLREYVASYPQVELDLKFMDSEEGCQAVEHGDLEIAIVTLPSEPSKRLKLTTIWQDPLGVVVAPNHPLAAQAEVGIPALAQYPAILPSAATYTHAIVRQRFAELGVELNVRMETNYLETILMMVGIGLGWSTLPQSMLNDEVVAVPIKGLQLQRQLGVVIHANRTLSNAGEAMLGLLLNHRNLPQPNATRKPSNGNH